MIGESKIEVAADVELSDVLEFAACALAALEENDDREAERIIDGFLRGPCSGSQAYTRDAARG